PNLGGLQRHHAGGVADHERDDHESKPTQHRRLTVSRAPSRSPGGEVLRRLSHGCISFQIAKRRSTFAACIRSLGHVANLSSDRQTGIVERLDCGSYLPTISAPTQVGGGAGGRGVRSTREASSDAYEQVLV